MTIKTTACIVCSDRNTRGWKQVQTKFDCMDCNLPMCPTVCFKLYHTCMDFKTAAPRHIFGLQYQNVYANKTQIGLNLFILHRL